MDVSQHAQLPILRSRSKSGSETVHYPLLYDGFPEEFKCIAEEELNETEQKKKNGIKNLKKIIKRENMPKLDDSILVAILRSSKYNLKKSEARLRKFVPSRQEVMELISAMDMDKAEKILDDTAMGFLPYRTKNGAIIAYTRPYGFNLDLYDVDDIAVLAYAACLLFSSQPITSVAGFVYFGECKSPSLHLFYPIIKTARRFLGHLLGLPIRICKIEVLNENFLVRWFFQITRPFFSRKVYGRVEFHGDSYDKIHETYSSNLLPDVFDGSMGPLSNIHCKQRILDFMVKLKAEFKTS